MDRRRGPWGSMSSQLLDALCGWGCTSIRPCLGAEKHGDTINDEMENPHTHISIYIYISYIPIFGQKKWENPVTRMSPECHQNVTRNQLIWSILLEPQDVRLRIWIPTWSPSTPSCRAVCCPVLIHRCYQKVTSKRSHSVAWHVSTGMMQLLGIVSPNTLALAGWRSTCHVEWTRRVTNWTFEILAVDFLGRKTAQ